MMAVANKQSAYLKLSDIGGGEVTMKYVVKGEGKFFFIAISKSQRGPRMYPLSWISSC